MLHLWWVLWRSPPPRSPTLLTLCSFSLPWSVLPSCCLYPPTGHDTRGWVWSSVCCGGCDSTAHPNARTSLLAQSTHPSPRGATFRKIEPVPPNPGGRQANNSAQLLQCPLAPPMGKLHRANLQLSTAVMPQPPPPHWPPPKENCLCWPHPRGRNPLGPGLF